jgi:hypothetical protein
MVVPAAIMAACAILAVAARMAHRVPRPRGIGASGLVSGRFDDDFDNGGRLRDHHCM